MILLKLWNIFRQYYINWLVITNNISAFYNNVTQVDFLKFTLIFFAYYFTKNNPYNLQQLNFQQNNKVRLYAINIMQHQNKSPSVARPEFKSVPVNQVYDQILRSFDKQALRIRFKFSNPAFDDAMILKPRKVLPKIQDGQKKARLRFYSNKIVANEAVYINQRRQYDPKQKQQQETQFQKLFIPNLKQTSVLSERNKRIMELYRRAQFYPQKIKLTPSSQLSNKINNIQMSPLENERSTKLAQNLPNDHNMLNTLREAKQRKRKLQPPFMRSQRSKSNIALNSYQISNQLQTPDTNTLECKKIQQKVEDLQQKKGKTMKRLKYEPNKQIVKIKRRFNWKAEPLTIHKIEKQQYYRVLRHYLGIPEPIAIQSGFYKAYIGSGNNSALIKKLLKQRGCWTYVESLEQQPNFVWTQIRNEKFNKKLPSKQKIGFIQIKRKSVELNNQLSSFIKLKQNDYILGCAKLLEQKHFLILIKELKQRFEVGQNISYFAKLSNVLVDYMQDYRAKQSLTADLRAVDTKVHNHMSNSGTLGDKKSLLKMMQKYCEIFDQNVQQYIPVTLHLLSPENQDQIFQKMPTGPWILKPGEATNRGQGITIHTSKQTLLAELNKKKKHKGGVKYTNIIQQYIDPLLYHGRKFDIRIWVLWSGRRLWWYREGYLRTSSKQFSYKSVNKFIHLTNDAIQSQGQDFGKYEPANKLSFNQFQKYLQSQHNYNCFYTEMLTQMKRMAMKAFRIGNLLFDQQNKQFNFELFGLDFLIDNKFKPWLIQCNTNPCLEINCSLLARLIPNMLDNVLNITTDIYFPPPAKKRKNDSTNWSQQLFKFQLIYNGVHDTQMDEKMLNSKVKVEYNQQQQQAQWYNPETINQQS